MSRRTNNKGQAIPAIFVLIVIVIGVFALININGGGAGLSILTIPYGGLSFTDPGHDDLRLSCNYGYSESDVAVNDGFLIMSIAGSQASQRVIEADVTGQDEFLIIYDAEGRVDAASDFGVSLSMSAGIVGSESGTLSQSASISAGRGESQSRYFEPGIWKFKNNFDGTWSSLRSIGVGDVFVVENTVEINGAPKLRLAVSGGNGCGGFQNTNKARTHSYSGQLRIYNIIPKENAFAVCKADEFIQDINQDGKITADECFDLNSIVLNREEAVLESDLEKQQRVIDELEQKQSGLETQNTELQEQIELLQQQNSDTQSLQAQLEELQSELAATNQQIANVQANDKNVIASIEHDEQFREPGKAKSLFNRIIAFIKGLFGLGQ